MSKVKLMLVDDHEVVRLGLKSLINRFENIEVIAEASSEDEAHDQALLHKPDVILMDIRLDGGSGINACQRIMQSLPLTKVIMLTSFAEDELLFDSIRSGAVGYVLKQVGTNDLVRTIEAAARGESILDPALTQKVFSAMRSSLEKEDNAAFDELTDQELQVLRLITEGKTNKQIAESLFLSHGTIRNYVSNVLGKLGVTNRSEATAYAITHHLSTYLDKMGNRSSGK